MKAPTKPTCPVFRQPEVAASAVPALLLLLLSPVVLAQQVTPAPTVKPTDKKDDVVSLAAFTVSGSHLAGASTFTTPVPVTVLEVPALNAAAPPNLADAMKQLPYITPNGGVTYSAGTGNSSANQLVLRGLGASRTLTLVDGHRFTPSDSTGQVDANMIPQALVHHVHVVTGGASATYGSDAVAGVVNFVLDHNFNGFKSDFYYGAAQAGHNLEYKGAVTYRTNLPGGRAHLLVGVEYVTNKGVAGDARELRRHAPNQIPDPST